jgi:hypothetical protein
MAFTYDSSASSNPFSNFTVIWAGTTFDFTASANAGGSVGGSQGGTASPTNVFLLLTASAFSTSNTTNWFMGAGSPTTFNLNDIYINSGTVQSNASVFAPTTLTGSPGSFGSFGVAAVREPSRFLLMLAGFVCLALRRMDRRGAEDGLLPTRPPSHAPA